MLHKAVASVFFKIFALLDLDVRCAHDIVKSDVKS